MRITVSQLRRIIKEEVSRVTGSRRRLVEGAAFAVAPDVTKNILLDLADLARRSPMGSRGFGESDQGINSVAQVLQARLKHPVGGMWRGYSKSLHQQVLALRGDEQFAKEVSQMLSASGGTLVRKRGSLQGLIDNITEPGSVMPSVLKSALLSLEREG